MRKDSLASVEQTVLSIYLDSNVIVQEISVTVE